MEKYKFYRYLFADTVSWFLLIVNIFLFVGYVFTGQNVSAFLGITALNMFYNLFEKARFFKKLDENVKDKSLREILGL